MKHFTFILMLCITLPLSAQDDDTITLDENSSYDTYPDEDEFAVPFSRVDAVPRLKECKELSGDALRDCFVKTLETHLTKQMDYPQHYRATDSLAEQVQVMFTVNRKGTLYDIKVRARTRDADKKLMLENQAKDIIKKLPKMEPGMHRNKKASVICHATLYFPREK